jgi:hypothetical protein
VWGVHDINSFPSVLSTCCFRKWSDSYLNRRSLAKLPCTFDAPRGVFFRIFRRDSQHRVSVFSGSTARYTSHRIDDLYDRPSHTADASEPGNFRDRLCRQNSSLILRESSLSHSDKDVPERYLGMPTRIAVCAGPNTPRDAFTTLRVGCCVFGEEHPRKIVLTVFRQSRVCVPRHVGRRA